jgi:hypothetical protein
MVSAAAAAGGVVSHLWCSSTNCETASVFFFFFHTSLPTQFIGVQCVCNRNVLRGAKRDRQGSFIIFSLLLFSFFYVALI